MGKSFFWRLNATNALGGSSGHQRTPFLTGIQLGLNFFGKVFCQHCDRRSASILFLTKICSILFTLFTLSGAVWHNDYNCEEDKERCWWWPLLSLMDVLEKSLKFVTDELISDRTPIKCYIFQEVRNMSTYQHWRQQWLRHFDPFLFLVLAAEFSNYQRGQMHW